MTRALRPLVALLLAVLAGLGTAASSAAAAAADERATITGVGMQDGTVTGVLTARTPVPLSKGTVRATLDGRNVPVRLSDEVRAQRRVMLVIDTSGSMGESGMATVRSAVSGYLRAAPPDVLVGVVSFAATSGVDLAPTTDRPEVQRTVNGLASDGDTDLYGGLAAALGALEKTRGDRSVVLLSDGADTIAAQPRAALDRVTRRLATTGVRLDVVRFRTDDPAAVGALDRLAAAGSGGVVVADDQAGVSRAFGAAATALRSQVTFRLEVPDSVTDESPLVLSGRAGGVAFRASHLLDPGTATASTAPGSGKEVSGAPAAAGNPQGFTVDRANWWVVPTVSAVTLGLGLLLLVVAYAVPKRGKRQQRVEDIEGYLPWAAPATHASRAEPSAVAARLVALGDRVAEGRESTTKTVMLIRRADLRLTPGEWLVLRGIALVVLPASAFLVTRAWPMTLAAAMVALVGPPLVLRFLASRRASKFERQLPDVLFLLSTSLNSGFGLSQAVDSVARDAPDPVSAELGRAQAETRLGTDLPDALERVAERMNSTALGWAVMAIRIQAQVGGNLAETLQTTAQTLREREALQRQVRALSAEGRISGYILIALPILLAVYNYMVNPEHISLLWTHPLGLMMSVATIVMMGIGIVWMRKVVKVEV